MDKYDEQAKELLTMRSLNEAVKAVAAALRELGGDYERACQTIAAMHAAAMGEMCGSRRGVVEDIDNLRVERNLLKAQIMSPTMRCPQCDWLRLEIGALRARLMG